jgi:hypothetical protein
MLKKVFCLLLVVLTTSAVLTSCKDDENSGGGLPNGTYLPVNGAVATTAISAIIIDGDKFTQVMPGGYQITVKYVYENGKISFPEGGISVPCEYKDDTLYYNGIPFVREK